MSIDFLSDVLIPSVLALGPLYFLYTLLWPAIPTPFSAANPVPTTHADGYTWIPLKAQEALLLRDYTPRELEPFNGKTPGGRILLAIKGTVFDVTAGGQFYGPGASSRRRAHRVVNDDGASLADHFSSWCGWADGPYGNFAGRDASRGMAKQSFELGKRRRRAPPATVPR